VIDLATNEKRLIFSKASSHDPGCWEGSIALSHNGQVFVACSVIDDTMTAWNTTTGQVHAVYEVPQLADSVCFSPDDTLLAIRCVGDASNRRVLEHVIKNQDWLNWLCPPPRHTVLLDADTGRRRALLPYAKYVAFAPDGKTLVTYDEKENAILFWDVLPKTGLRRPAPWLALGAAVLLSIWWWLARRRENGVRRDISFNREPAASA